MKAKPSLTQLLLVCATLLQAINSQAQPVTRVATGWYHSLFLKSDGSLWAMGDNEYGQLGIGYFPLPGPYPLFGTNVPQLVFASNVTAIAAGAYHSLFLKSDGSLWAVGANSNSFVGPAGPLGDGTFNNINLPEMIVASNVTAIAAGGFHSLFLKSDGSLWAMGYNAQGQLGDGTYNTTNLPEMIVASNVTAIAGGLYHSMFLKSDGSLWGMGFNQYGQLGDGSNNSTNRPEMIVASNVTAVSVGQVHSMFLKSDGSLWVMGYNQDGILGDGNYYNNTNQPEMIVASNVITIEAGYFDSLFQRNDSSLWGTGNNGQGELGDGTYNNMFVPQELVASGVTAFAGGGSQFTLFARNDGSLWAMGANSYGQLGDNTTNLDNGNFNTNRPEEIVAGPPGYNQISGQFLSGGKLGLYYMGMTGTNYELDHSFSLSPANWIPQATNPAGTDGVLIFTNTPDAATNNFWRIRSVP